MGNWFKRVWNTPGGSASALCLNMLEENNLLIVGQADSCRQQLRESLLYTLLYKSPVSLHLVLLGEVFHPYSELPHVDGYYKKYKDIYGVLVRIGEIIDDRVNQPNLPVLYVFIEDYAALLAYDAMIAFQITRIVKDSKSANIRLVVFTEPFESPATMLSANAKMVSGSVAYKGALYSVPVVSSEQCRERIAWWTEQHKRSFFDKLGGLSPSSAPTVANMTGLQYESYVAQKLKKKGYKGIEVTQASGDYGADIIATDSKGRRTCFQCKKYHGSVGVAAVQEVIAAKAYYNCEKAVVITTATFTPNAQTLAEKAGVTLISNFY